MAVPPELRIAVASDLHCFVESEETRTHQPSHLVVSASAAHPGYNPIAGLLDLIKSGIKADILMCPGDLGDKARPEGIQYAWQQLNLLKEALGAKLLVGTTGNHDVDSRFKFGNADPQQVLKDLNPPFPLPDEGSNDKYWARDFVMFTKPKFRLVVLNSSAHHGEMDHEKNHGRITRTTIEVLRRKLSEERPSIINLLLCHHHPQPHSELNLGSADVMEDGQLLLDLLGSGRYGRWMVIHGHKHHPKVTYAAGGCNSPVVIAAGSLCAELYKDLQTAARNQFHVVTLDASKIDGNGLTGRVRSWNWAVGIGWGPATPGSGLPHNAGFGYRGDLQQLATRVAAAVTSRNMNWEAVISRLPELDFVLPQDYVVLKEILQEKHGIGISEENGEAREVGKQ